MTHTNLETTTNRYINLRSNDTVNLKIPKCNKNFFGQRSFNYLAPKYWNALPSEIKSQTNRNKFIKMLKLALYEY